MPAKIEGPQYRDIYTLHIWKRTAPGRVAIAMNDGTYSDIEEGIVPPEGAGILIPGDLFEDVFKAFLEYKGFKSHDATEVKVLREWLTVERARVQAFIDEISHKALS